MTSLKQRYFLRFSFDGTKYHGWQLQKNALSVQQVLNNVISACLKTDTRAQGCGRTDTGAHAKEFFAQFDTEVSLNASSFLKEINSLLPPDINVNDIFSVLPDAHARHHAISRTYEYYINQISDELKRRKSYFVYSPIDVDLLNDAAKILMEYDDFTSFCKVHTQVSDKKCKIIDAFWKRENNDVIFTITANRFLRGMVRAIVGTSLDLNKGKIDLAGFRKIIECEDRTKAGPNVPAWGLYLSKVTYPNNIFVNNR